MATWNDLPAPVQAAVIQHVGIVTSSREIPGGKNNDLAVALSTPSGPVFVKGVEGVSKRMRMLRNEITAADLAPGLAPALLFHEDVAGWLVVGFEYVPGRPADLSPYSPDLPPVAGAVNRLGTFAASGVRPLRDRWGGVDWWRRLADEAPGSVQGWDVGAMSELASRVPELVDGDRLLHTDLHGDQFLLGDDDAVHIIDWGFPGAGAPWVDGAFLVLRLFEAGHTAGAAEVWARRALPAFAEVDDKTLTAFAAYLAGMWTHWAVMDERDPGKQHRARLARWFLSARIPG